MVELIETIDNIRCVKVNFRICIMCLFSEDEYYVHLEIQNLAGNNEQNDSFYFSSKAVQK